MFFEINQERSVTVYFTPLTLLYSHWVEDISEDQRKGEFVNPKPLPNPSEETINRGDQADDSQYVGHDLTCNDNTEHSSLRKGMESICGRVFYLASDYDVATGYRFIRLREAEFGDGDGRGNGHDRSGD